MKILFITHFYNPHIGGVERHVGEISKCLKKQGHKIFVLTERYSPKIKGYEKIDGIFVTRFTYLHKKYFGILSIWLNIFRNRKLIGEADIVHCHDVFVWFLPFRLLYFKKPVFTTIHGLEWDDPLKTVSIFQKHAAAYFSKGIIGIGKFLEKYLHLKFDLITFGAAHIVHAISKKSKNRIVYVGRLEENTGLREFLKWLSKNSRYEVDFCGDGRLRDKCLNYGNVHGFVDPTQFYKDAEYCVPGGYLAALEGLSYGCKLKLFWNNRIKRDYWMMSPFVLRNVKTWAKKQTWSKLANEYLNLYNSSK